MSVTIRDIGPGDFDKGLRDCLAALYPGFSGNTGWKNVMAAIVRGNNGIRTLVATDECGNVVGTASFFLEKKFTHDCGWVGHVDDVAIRPDWQGSGVGKLLMQYIVRLCRERGCYKVVLDCSEAVAPFYAKLGFYEAAVQMRLDMEISRWSSS